jgi:hypothetical protein
VLRGNPGEDELAALALALAVVAARAELARRAVARDRHGWADRAQLLDAGPRHGRGAWSLARPL